MPPTIRIETTQASPTFLAASRVDPRSPAYLQNRRAHRRRLSHRHRPGHRNLQVPPDLRNHPDRLSHPGLPTRQIHRASRTTAITMASPAIMAARTTATRAITMANRTMDMTVSTVMASIMS